MSLKDEIDALLPVRSRAAADALVALMDELPHDGIDGLWVNEGVDVIEACADGWHPKAINEAARALTDRMAQQTKEQSDE